MFNPWLVGVLSFLSLRNCVLNIFVFLCEAGMGKRQVDSQHFSHLGSEWDQEVQSDMGTQKYVWLLQFRYRPKYCPQITSPDTGADHLKKV